MAATALSMASPSPEPPLVASRRIEFRVAHNSFSKWKYARVACFIAISEAVRERLVADGIPRQKTTVVHEGVDVERIVHLPTGNVHAAFFLPTHAPVVGNIGALVAQKGQHHLIDAAAIVVRAVPDARFVICGDGDLRPALEEQIKRKHLERHVFLAGFRPDVLELLKGFDLFALSSLQEGLCTSLVDAMAASKAAVATRVGGVPEVVADGETGLLVPPRDHDALANGITTLLKDRARRTRMGEAGLKRARKLFTVDHMVEGTMATYERLLGVTAR
jgi:glycosyltransferase involved in cell wall biosynthesis